MKRGRAGIEYEDLELGEGPRAERGSQVTIVHDLRLNRGELLQEQQESVFRLGGRSVVAGLEYGVEGMRQGGLRRIRFGPHLGYGEAGVPGLVPGDALLEFRVT